MASVMRTQTNIMRAPKTAAAPTVTRRARLRLDSRDVELPTVPSEVSHNLSDYSIFIHGVPRAGKTTLAMVEPGVLLLTFDPPDKSMPWLQMHMKDWPTFLKTLAALEAEAVAGTYIYKRVVVDGGEIMHRYCQNYVEDEELGVNHISEAQWGKGFDRMNAQFANAVDRLLALPGGCWFICHSEWKQIETRHGSKTEKLCPLIKSRAEDQLVGKTFANFAYIEIGTRRALIVRGDERISAGCKIKGHFFTPEGQPVIEIPMGTNEQEAWDNFTKAFNNQQTATHLPSTATQQHPRQAAATTGGLMRTGGARIGTNNSGHAIMRPANGNLMRR